MHTLTYHPLTQVNLCELWPLGDWGILIEHIQYLLLGLSDGVTVQQPHWKLFPTLSHYHTIHNLCGRV